MVGGVRQDDCVTLTSLSLCLLISQWESFRLTAKFTYRHSWGTSQGDA
jgi:hypothetical protein